MRSASSAFVLGLLVLGLPSRPALPATPTASFGVSATVQATCLVSASAGTLGTYAGAMLNPAATVSVNCTNPTPYNISLDVSAANSAAAPTRTTTETDSTLPRHTLVSNFHEVINRGRMVDADTVAGVGNSSVQVVAVDGKISAREHLGAPDTITVTIIY